jgi:hypothetical protein
MKILNSWHTEDFDSLSWHDVHVHGFQFVSFKSDEGVADLAFDIDYILDWDNSGSQFLFTVCRAELTFHDVFGLKLELDYVTPTAGMCSFSIDSINREPLEYTTGVKSYRWQIKINWPYGFIEFEAPSFTQKLIGEPIISPRQSLSPEERECVAK